MAERIQPSPVTPVEGETAIDLAAPVERLDALATQARSAQDGHGKADALSGALLKLRGHPSRASADAVLRLLEGGGLEGLTDSEGRTCRAVAVEVLLSFGFPYALEVTPEDLTHYRAFGRGRRRVAGLLAGGLLVLALSGQQLGFALAAGERVSLTVVHAAVTLLAAAGLALARRTPARWLARAALIVCGALGIAGWQSLGLDRTFIPALGALVAALLMNRRTDG